MRLALALVSVSVVALAAAALAPSKDGAHARLATKLPLGAAPGTTIRVGWTVTVPDGKGGRRPFGANGMFVRLLSRTGAASTIGIAPTGSYTDGRYAVHVQVPEGGIGGIRLGLRGTSDLVFPLRNDPFASRSGLRCDVATVRTVLGAFVRAYNSRDMRRLDRTFTGTGFVRYAPGQPDIRRLARGADRLTLDAYRFEGYNRARAVGYFLLSGERRVRGFRGGRWYHVVGKGILGCSRSPVTLTALSLADSG